MQVLVSNDGIYANVLKVKPPMVFSCEDASNMLMHLSSSLQEMSSAGAEIEALQAKMIAKIAPGQLLAREYFRHLLAEQ